MDNPITVIVKVLNGEELQMSVHQSMSVLQFKSNLSGILGVSCDQIKLVHKGKKLTDGQTLNDHKIGHGSKLNLIMSSSVSKEASLHSKKTEQVHITKEKENHPTFWKDFDTFLRKHFTTQDVAKIMIVFKQKYHDVIQQMSLDDIERIATQRLPKETRTQ